MAFTKQKIIFETLIFFSENKALGWIQSASGVYFKVSRVSIESAPWFIWWRIKKKPGALSIEPQLTLKWTPTQFEMNPRSTLKWTQGLIFKIEKTKKIHVKFFFFVKAINLNISLSVNCQKLIFKLEIPLYWVS